MSFKRVSLWFSSLVKVEGKILSSLDLQTMAWKEAISSIMTKVEMSKIVQLEMWFLFHIWSGNFFAIWIPSCNVYILAKKFFTSNGNKCSTSDGKKFSHLHISTFAIIEETVFDSEFFYWAINLYKHHFNTILKQMDVRSFLCFLDQKRSQEHSVSIFVLTLYC